MSNLNPKLSWVELGLGFDNILQNTNLHFRLQDEDRSICSLCASYFWLYIKKCQIPHIFISFSAGASAVDRKPLRCKNPSVNIYFIPEFTISYNILYKHDPIQTSTQPLVMHNLGLMQIWLYSTPPPPPPPPPPSRGSTHFLERQDSNLILHKYLALSDTTKLDCFQPS